MSPKIDANILQDSRLKRVTTAAAKRACRSIILAFSSSYGLGPTTAAAIEPQALAPKIKDTAEAEKSNHAGLRYTAASESASFDSNDLSARMNFVLGSPRRYGVRFDRLTRTLEIRITPARSEEFKAASFYDGRIVHRVVTKERNNEVFLEIQLKNASLDWMVTHQEHPWRLIIDIWGRSKLTTSQGAPWIWDGFYDSRSAGTSRTEGNAAGNMPGDSRPLLTEGKATAETVQGPQAALDLPVKEEAPPPAKVVASAEQKAAVAEPHAPGAILARYLAVQKEQPASPAASISESARQAYLQGDAVTALRLYRRYASLNQREFTGDPEAIWLAGESALAVGQNDAAQDYFSTLVRTNRGSTYAYYGDLRLLDLDFGNDVPSDAKSTGKDILLDGYRALLEAPGATTVVKAMAALRIARRDPKGASGDAGAALLPSYDACSRESALRTEIRQECAYESFAYKIARADMVSAQALIKDYEKSWKGDPRIAEQRNLIMQKMVKTLEGVTSPADFARWQDVESKSEAAYLKGTEGRSDLLARRAQSWQRAGNNTRALALYLRAAEVESDPEKLIPVLARAANLAAKSGEATKANSALNRIQSIPSRKEKGLPAEEYALIKEIALPPTSNRIALGLVLDDVAKGFHAENDIRTIVTLAERLDGARDADVLYEKLLAIPSRSAAEAELKEDSLMNYAEVLRNQGRLVKSADTFLAVANLDNGKSRAEAAYKAGVIYFRAGLLEKATSSWNIAANDLANSKFSALASERLNRIR